jgi:hypothetical protein
MTLVAWAERHAPPDEGCGKSFTLRMRETGEKADPVVVDANSGKRITHRTVFAERSQPHPLEADARAETGPETAGTKR